MKRNLSFFLSLLLLLTSSCSNKGKMIITSVYEGDNGKAVYFDTEEKKGNLFISDNLHLYTILDKTDGNTWIIVEQAPAVVGEGRVETELQLWNIPESRQIDPPYSLYGSSFEKKDGKDCLVISTGDGTKEIIVSLADLLSGTLPEKAESAEAEQEIQDETGKESGTESTPETGLQTVVLLKLGTKENEIGQGMVDKQLEGGRFIYAVPSFAAFENRLYIVDAINFRVLVYDYSGNFVRKISYPEKSEDGSVNVVMDICVDKGVLYLAATYSNLVYVVDSETEDIIEIITGSDTEKGKFKYLDILALDHEKNLLISDYEYNILYVYKRDVDGMHLLRGFPYTEKDQLVFDTEGKNYSAASNGQEVTVSDSQGNVVGSFMYKFPSGNSHIIDIDDNNVIYIQTFESESPGAQVDEGSYLKVMQQDGTILNDYPVPVWPGGPMTKYIVVDEQGNIFVAEYDFTGSADTESQDIPPTGLLIRKAD
ncbi:MAG: hypothetical protein NTW82_10790 [Bacteroidia bacterium]|nr:hypothetical protein [Bacteroidia bacterium]